MVRNRNVDSESLQVFCILYIIIGVKIQDANVELEIIIFLINVDCINMLRFVNFIIACFNPKSAPITRARVCGIL